MHFAGKKKERQNLCWACVGVSFCALTLCVVFLLLSKDGTAAIIVKTGPFSLDDPKDYSVDVRISDGGAPVQTSITTLAIKVCLWATIASQSTHEPPVIKFSCRLLQSCRCDARRIPTQCKAGARRMGVSVHALISILLCILTILGEFGVVCSSSPSFFPSPLHAISVSIFCRKMLIMELCFTVLVFDLIFKAEFICINSPLLCLKSNLPARH